MTIVLALFLLASLLIIPLGLPGVWLMVLSGIAYLLLVPAAHFGWMVILGSVLIGVFSEVLDFVLSARYTRKYGGSRVGAWGAVIGGLAGAIVGVPVPVIGSVIGAFAGSFLGALAAEYLGGATHGAAARAATGATIGRAIATAAKIAAGCVIAAWILGAAVFG
ncbi:MAG: DUF456 domain-containing protein [Gemmatimonadaceae bacterium]|nr:DUF456 domain-containing protein [Gemmatimonadaceae bacterium]